MQDLDLTRIDGKELTIGAFLSEQKRLKEELTAQDGYEVHTRIFKDKIGIKKYLEEIVPISYYIESIFTNSSDQRICWKSGSQPGDCKLIGRTPEILEVTTARHKNQYLVEEHMNLHGFAWGAEGTKKHKGVITSKVTDIGNDELVDMHFGWIYKSIEAKASKHYPEKQIRLIVYVLSYTIIRPQEIETIERKLACIKLPEKIYELFVCFDLCSAKPIHIKRN